MTVVGVFNVFNLEPVCVIFSDMVEVAGLGHRAGIPLLHRQILPLLMLDGCRLSHQKGRGNEDNRKDQYYLSFHSVQVTGYGLQVTGYRLQVTGYRLQVTGYRLQVTGVSS